MLMLEARHALRVLRKSPAFTAVAVLTLALGIGVNTAIFSVVDGVLLRPLPYERPERLTFMLEGAPEFPQMSVAFADFQDWRKRQHSFVDIGAVRPHSYTLTGLGQAERLKGRMISANFFRVLGVHPALGRDFLDAEDQPNAPPVAIVSDKLWRERMNADAGAVGRTLMLDGRAFTIVGVLPAGFHFQDEAAVYVTLANLDPQVRQSRGMHPGLYGIGRLKDGVTVEAARRDMETIGRQLMIDAGRADSTIVPKLWPLQSKLVEDVRATLWLLLGAVAFVLLIACANVANLLLARGTARSHELAVRAALGADRWALMRPMLVESALIAVGGGTLGVIVALWGVDLLVALKPAAIPRDAVIKIDGVVLGYSLLVTTLTALVCGVVPALRAARVEVHDALKAAGTRSVAGLAHGRLRALLVVVEVALALVLLVGAGLSLRTFRHLSRLDVGFKSDDLETAALAWSPRRYDAPDKVRAMVDEVQRRLAAAPGVEGVAIGQGMPFVGAPEQDFWLPGHPDKTAFAVWYAVMPGYLDALGITRLAGRDLDAGDGPKAQPVCLVDETLAKAYFGGAQAALGRHINVGTEKDPMPLTIVGVTRHILHYGLEGAVPASYQVYMPLVQLPDRAFALIHDVDVALRGPHPAQLAAAARTALDAWDPEMPLSDVQPMEQRIADSVGGRKFAMLLLLVFAGVALGLAVVGLYAVLSYMVTQRQHEIGVRMALGASAGDVQRMVVRQALTLVAIGLLLGLGAALALTRVLSSLVNGVTATDPATYAAVGLVLAVAAALASLLPARAATRVDPMVALRYE